MKEIIKFEPLQLDQFKKVSSKDFWKVYGRQGAFYDDTIDSDKVAGVLAQLAELEERAQWISGKFFAEMAIKIQEERDKWDFDYYKDIEKKPEYTSLKDWCADHYQITRVSYPQAKRNMWIYVNVAVEDADLGYKKNKLINDILQDDVDIKKEVRRIVRQLGMSEDKIERMLAVLSERLTDEAERAKLKKETLKLTAKKKILNQLAKIEEYESKDDIKINKITSAGRTVIITCANKADADIVRDVIVDLEDTIKLKAFRRKK